MSSTRRTGGWWRLCHHVRDLQIHNMHEGEVVCPTIPSLARVSRVSELVSGLSVSLAGETRNKAGKAVPFVSTHASLRTPGARAEGSGAVEVLVF